MNLDFRNPDLTKVLPTFTIGPLFLKIDFNKDYDCIDWAFIYGPNMVELGVFSWFLGMSASCPRMREVLV